MGCSDIELRGREVSEDKIKTADPRLIEKHSPKFGADQPVRLLIGTNMRRNGQNMTSHHAFICICADVKNVYKGFARKISSFFFCTFNFYNSQNFFV